jgi:hypothetical protein
MLVVIEGIVNACVINGELVNNAKNSIFKSRFCLYCFCKPNSLLLFK